MIFVTGCARSGTSLVTQLLQAHGCYLGKADRVNSLFENVSVRENILKPILMRADVDPLGQDVLPDTNNLPPEPTLRDAVLRYFAGGVMNGSPHRAYKDAKLTLVWPLFHAAFPAAKWILVRRDKASIVDSCMRTGFMRKRSTPEAWAEWVDEHEKRFVDMRAALNLIEVWTDEVVSMPRTFEEVADFCGLDFKRAAMTKVIDARIWHPHVQPPRRILAEASRRSQQ